MTTKKQIKALFGRLIARNDDLAVSGRFVVVKPLRHVLRSISIDRSSDADFPQFYWHIGHAFSPSARLQGLCLGNFWIPRERPDHWSQPGFAEAAIDMIEQQVLPMLRRVQTIEDMFRVEGVPRSAEYDNSLRLYEPHQMHMHAAFGRLDEARAIYERTKDWYLNLKFFRRWDFEKASQLGALAAAGDRRAVAALLHQWEEEFVARAGLGAIYERTPFPLESGPMEGAPLTPPPA